MAKITMKSEEQINKNKLQSLLKTRQWTKGERESERMRKRERERKVLKQGN